MNHLLIGSQLTDNTTELKNMISEIEGKVIVLDFNNQYDELTDNVLFLDKLNPSIGDFSLDDAKALNAGYLPTSQCLRNMCEEILRETKSQSKHFLIEEAVERLQNSWEDTKSAYGKILNSKIPIKRKRAHYTLEEASEIIFQEDIILLKTKNMLAEHLRGVLFILVSHLSRATQEKITFIIDDIPTIINHGNIKLWLETIDFSKSSFLLSLNKASNVSPLLLPLFDQVHIFRFSHSSEVKELEKLNLLCEKDPTKFKIGEKVTISLTSSQNIVSS